MYKEMVMVGVRSDLKFLSDDKFYQVVNIIK